MSVCVYVHARVCVCVIRIYFIYRFFKLSFTNHSYRIIELLFYRDDNNDTLLMNKTPY